jgi:ribosomal protein S18 acetylase RimI-like enzyme
MVEIKESCLDEILALDQIHNEALRFFTGIDPKPSVTPPKVRMTQGCLPPNGTFENYRTVTLYVNDEIIGYCDYYMGYPTEDVVYISILYMSECFRNHGYASSAVDLLCNQFYSLGYRHLRLRVSLTNWIGIRFWVKKGFSKITKVEAKTNYSKGAYGGIELEKILKESI